MHEIPRMVLVRLPTVMGVDLSITNQVVLLWLSAALTFVLVVLACRRRTIVPENAYQNFFEGVIEFINVSVVKEGIGEAGRRWAPFLLSLFFFILFTNLSGLIPLPNHSQAMTSNINVTLALAMVVFAVTLGISLRQHGMRGFLSKFLPGGVPLWVAPLVVPIEILSWLLRPVSLAIRLCANMLAGHQLILVFVGMTASLAWMVKPLPYLGAVVIGAFEIFVAFIQAFIFTLLSGIYIKDALEAHH